jgi:hypothetical protein
MANLCPDYAGGLWSFIELSNDGAYIVPTGAETFDLCVDSNGFNQYVSADAAGLIATAFALNTLVWRGYAGLNEKYQQLRDYIDQHPERRLILQALD